MTSGRVPRLFCVFISTLLFLLTSILAIAGDVYVGGYYRKDGTYVRPHIRSSPNSSRSDNYGPSQNSDQLMNPRSRDYDSDGIPNYMDRDDDNDGIRDDYDSSQYGRWFQSSGGSQMEILFVGFIFWILFGIAGGMIGGKKGQGCLGFILGVLLGPIGLVIALLTRGNRVTCPFCKELIPPNSLRCPKCQAILQETSYPSMKLDFDADSEQKKCPTCAESIKLEAIKCRYCGHEFIPEETKNLIEKRKQDFAHKLAEAEYKLVEDKFGDAYCIGCQRASNMNGMYYHAKTDTYYHKNCLPQWISILIKGGMASLEKRLRKCRKGILIGSISTNFHW
jgi:hypothetical protein